MQKRTAEGVGARKMAMTSFKSAITPFKPLYYNPFREC